MSLGPYTTCIQPPSSVVNLHCSYMVLGCGCGLDPGGKAKESMSKEALAES